MPGEREVDHLLDRYINAQCLIGRIIDIRRTVDLAGTHGTLITLDGVTAEGLVRQVVALDQGARMFPRFLLGRIVRVVCRTAGEQQLVVRHTFLHLAHVEGLTDSQQNRLWPWREEAFEALTDPRLRLTAFEEGLCRTLLSWGRPPSPEQQRHFRRIAERRRSATNRLSREALLRAARHRPRPALEAPTPIGTLLVEALNELRDIWLRSQPH